MKYSFALLLALLFLLFLNLSCDTTEPVDLDFDGTPVNESQLEGIWMVGTDSTLLISPDHTLKLVSPSDSIGGGWTVSVDTLTLIIGTSISIYHDVKIIGDGMHLKDENGNIKVFSKLIIDDTSDTLSVSDLPDSIVGNWETFYIEGADTFKILLSFDSSNTYYEEWTYYLSGKSFQDEKYGYWALDKDTLDITLSDTSYSSIINIVNDTLLFELNDALLKFWKYDGVIIIDSIDTSNIHSVVFDDFSIHNQSDNYTIENTISSNLGSKLDSLSWGGGQWFAYASGASDGDSACVYTFNGNGDPDTIVSLAAIVPFNTKTDPLKMFGDDSLTVILDAKDAANDIEAGSYYYAAIGCAIAGDPDHLDGVTGYTRIEATDAGAGSKVDCITWDLSNLVSITLRGRCTGAFTFNFNGVKSDLTIGTVLSTVSSPDPANETDFPSFNVMIPVKDFVAARWNGATWEEINSTVHEIVIALDTDANVGGDFVSLKLDKILFNFDTQKNANAAFPFLAN